MLEEEEEAEEDSDCSESLPVEETPEADSTESDLKNGTEVEEVEGRSQGWFGRFSSDVL